MPDLAGPFDASAFSQAQWFRNRGPREASGVIGPPSTTVGGGELGLTAVGFALSLALGRAHVRGAAYERTGSAWTDTVPANSSGVGPRNDLVVLRRDLTAKTVVPLRLQGTAAASPADPAMTQAEDGVWDMPLFRVQAPPSSGTPLVLTDLRSWIDPGTGDIVGPWLDLPVIGSPYFAHAVQASQATAVNQVATCQYRIEGRRVAMRGWISSTNGVAVAVNNSNPVTNALPAAARPAYPVPLWPILGGAPSRPFRMELATSGIMYCIEVLAAGSYLNWEHVNWEIP